MTKAFGEIASVALDADIASVALDANIASVARDADIASVALDADIASVTRDADIASVTLDADIASVTLDADIASVALDADDAPATFVDSLRRTGFGVVRDVDWPAGLLARIDAEWLAFFRSDAPHLYLFDPVHHDGFFPATVSERAVGATARDLKEFFHVTAAGRFPAEVSDAALRYRALAIALGTTLLGWIQEHAPPEVTARFSQPLPGMIADSPLTLLRILHYPPLSGAEAADAVRAAAHEDINLLTILPASAQSGLEVLGSDGAWIAVPADAGCIVVNVGDMLQEASGGYFRSTTHRVRNPASEHRHTARLSLPVFLQPRAEIALSARITAGAFLTQRLAAIQGPP